MLFEGRYKTQGYFQYVLHLFSVPSFIFSKNGTGLVLAYPLSNAGHVLRRLDLSYLTHHRPIVRGNTITRKLNSAQWRKWQLSFGPVLINGRCIGYMLPDDS